MFFIANRIKNAQQNIAKVVLFNVQYVVSNWYEKPDC